jgi:hypothetical protein
MKALFVSYNQGYNEEIVDILDIYNQRGFTRWVDTQGRGTMNGEPHYGNHAWPQLNHSILAFVPDDVEPKLLAALRKKDAETPDLGLRAFVWDIEDSM